MNHETIIESNHIDTKVLIYLSRYLGYSLKEYSYLSPAFRKKLNEATLVYINSESNLEDINIRVARYLITYCRASLTEYLTYPVCYRINLNNSVVEYLDKQPKEENYSF